MGDKYFMRNCYWRHEYQDMNATITTCDYYGQYGSCPCSDECEHYISEQEVESIIRKEVEDEWIPVSEKLPQRDEIVLVSYKTMDTVHMCKYLDDGSENPWWSYNDDCLAWNNVILAWMPLPEPYREDGKEE